MVSSYDILKNEHSDNKDGYVSVTPYWIVAVFRLENPITYDRLEGESFSRNFSQAIKIVGPPLIVTDDCIQLQVSHSKQNYISQLNATFANSGINYLSQVFPGDYVFAWMVNDEIKFQSIIDRLLKKKAPSPKDSTLQDVPNQKGGPDDYSCNNFDDGLKFYGRVQSIRKTLSQQPNGLKIVRYSLSGVGFSEFDAQIFYNPYLATNQNGLPQISTFFAKLGIQLNEIIGKIRIGDNEVAGIKTTTALTLFIDLLLGRGVPKNLGQDIIPNGLVNTYGLDAEASYIVPTEVCEVLGKTEPSGNFFRFADILDCIVGVQKYQTHGNALEYGLNDSTITKVRVFQPDDMISGGTRRITNDLLGSFLPQIPHFSNKPVWTILRQYLNEPVNEMYTCLRVNPDGKIVPTFVARQLPFSSPAFKETEFGSTTKHTEFLELPRWVVAPSLVRDVDVGRSDALRFNWIGIYGDYPDPNRTITHQMVENLPKLDNLDIARSGLRMYMQTVSCSALEVRAGGINKGAPAKWMAICSDFLMGQQMSMTGTMNIIGVQSPICPGDNLEWDGTVFHIESVNHMCSISPLGQKTFITNLALSHGVRADPPEKMSNLSGAKQVDFYGGVKNSDMTQYEPGTTSTSKNVPILVDRAKERESVKLNLLMSDEDPSDSIV